MHCSSVCAEAEQQCAHCRTDGGAVFSLALKILIFGHTDKSNTSFKSVKTLRLFVCTHNNNKTRFCKIMNCELERETLCIFALQTLKNISIQSEMSTFKWTYWNWKQIFLDYVIRVKHAYRRIHYCGDDESVSPTSSLKPKTKKTLVYQWIIKMLMQPPYCFSLTHS